MFGELGAEAIDVILHHQLVGQIGCHANDTTYVVPISYAFKDDYIYALSQEGMKIDIMRLNPKVCFEVHTMENMANWQCVVVWGDYEELTTEPDREDAIKILLNRELPVISTAKAHITPDWPVIPEKDLSQSVKGVVFRIKITKKTGRYENHEYIPY
ncbi:pyridoxamine 5'-phosphate oxidase family protein [Parafilimonas sp.]|uniref:pyridoxamine 5'-phosphate oxidase family protein n=1 Tax=Parafilimonas sp. TaxID=1969739 RepID=UPI0039E6F87E